MHLSANSVPSVDFPVPGVPTEIERKCHWYNENMKNKKVYSSDNKINLKHYKNKDYKVIVWLN